MALNFELFDPAAPDIIRGRASVTAARDKTLTNDVSPAEREAAYHELTQDPEVLAALDKLVRFISNNSRDAAPGTLNGIGYLYLVLKDPVYIKMAERHLHYILGQQQQSRDPLMDGLMFKKPIYHRTNFY